MELWWGGGDIYGISDAITSEVAMISIIVRN